MDLAEIVEDALLFVGEHLSREGIHVLTTLIEVSLGVGDATALEQVLMNLLGKRSARPRRPGARSGIETSLAPGPSGGIRLVVSEMGRGMPPDVLARLAEPFFTTKRAGTGLGLSVSFRIYSASTAQRSTSSPTRSPSPSPFRHSRDAPPQPIFTRDASCRARRSGMALAASAVIERA